MRDGWVGGNCEVGAKDWMQGFSRNAQLKISGGVSS